MTRLTVTTVTVERRATTRSRSRRGAAIRHLGVGSVALLAAVLMSAPGFAAAPEYQGTPCARSFSRVAHTVACGTLRVDETRGRENGRRVEMPVVIVKARRPRPGTVPVIFLHGGPGGGVVDTVPGLLRSDIGKDLIGQDQDWIFFDQRGGARTVPALGCGSTLPLNDAGPLTESAATALVACGARYAASGIDLAAFNSVTIALDLQDLRHALHIERFDLFGVSYGTRVAFSALRTQPAGLRAMVLDSVWPAEANWAQGGPRMIADAAHLLFARCAADRECRSAFPHPEADLTGFAARLLEGPVTIKGRRYAADDLGGFLMDTLYDPQGARSLPRDAQAFARGDMSALDAQMADRSPYTEVQHLAHLCKEEFPFEAREHVADGVGGDPIGFVSVRSFQRYFDVCAALPVGPPDPAEGRSISSAVPTLFLSAEFDPGCPPALAQAAAARFSHGQFAVVPNTTHGPFRQSACARQMIRAFLADPSQRVDTSCLQTRPERFEFARQ